MFLKGKKIVFLFGSFDLGGAERQGLLLADFLRTECGADVRIWGLNPSPGRLSALCDERGIPWKGIRFHWGLKRRWFHFPRLIAALKKEAPDILVSSTCVPNLVCALGWRLAGAKLCVWNQADEGLLLNRWPLHRFAVRQPHCFISNSSGGKSFLEKSYGVPPERVHLIHNGISIQQPAKDRESWRRELGVAPDAFGVCMVANLSTYKDHETLVRGWREVIASGCYAAKPVLLLAGRFDGTERHLQKLAEELEIADSVRFLGKVDDVSGLLGAVDLFAYSSRSEGIPNAVLEAMAMGLPVVGTDIPGIREALGEEGDSLLVPVGDHEGLARKISMLMKDEGLRRRLGAALKKRADDEFSLERMCDRTVAVIAEALSNARQSGRR